MKAADHKTISVAAINQLNQLEVTSASVFFGRNINSITDASEDVDSAGYSRATNWHFYNDNCQHTIKSKNDFGFFDNIKLHKTSEFILQKRDVQLGKAIDEKDIDKICEYIGRILHHIQDMSTPSHVVPVYHGIIIKDKFESYLNDYLQSEKDPDSDIFSIQAGEFNALEKSKMFSIYKESAEDSLQYLYSNANTCNMTVGGEEQQLGWSYFWLRHEDNLPGAYPIEGDDTNYASEDFDGFGKFGPLGKHFGELDQFTKNTTTYQIKQEEYNKLCQYLVHKMTLESIRALKSLEERLTPVLS